MNAKTKTILNGYEKARTARYNWESHWREIRELVRTSTSTPGQVDVAGDRRTENIYDGAAPWALEQLAAGLNSFLTSPTDRWFNLGVAGAGENGRTGIEDDALLWLELVSDIIYQEYADPEVNLNPMLHECYMDLGGFGTTVLYQDYNWQERHIFFRSFPLADCYVSENAMGRVDKLYRKALYSTRQIKQEFSRPGDRIPAKILAEMDDEKMWTMVHYVGPRDDTYKIAKNFKFASVWVCCEQPDEGPLREHGYTEFPYHVPRWTKLAGEIYGRSPAMTCLPDIKMLNSMSKVTIKAAQKIVDPPLVVPDDGFMMPIKTSPSSLIFKTPGTESIEPLITNGRVEIGLDMQDQRREHIYKSFYVDWIIRKKKRERQSATEVMDDRNEMLRQMSPMLGRTQVELLNPMIVRTYNLLDAAGRIPDAPASMAGQELRIFYVSPAAKAQFGSKGTSLTAFINDIVQFAAIDPSIVDIVDSDVLARELAKFRDITRLVVRSPESIAQIREQRQQQAQIQAGAEAAKNLGSAAKNFAGARQIESAIQ